MPSRNIIKHFEPETYYHVYNRGVEKRDIFLDEQDYTVFLGLLKKYLVGNSEETVSKNRHKHRVFGDELELLSYCLMPNHYHLLFYQHSQFAIRDFLRSVITGYAMYFNDRHNRVGTLFQSRYKASQINADAYLEHISRYVHLNPENFEEWPYSSWVYYQGSKKAQWLNTDRLLSVFDGNRESYLEFVREFELPKKENDLLRWQLASPEDEL